MDIFKKNKVRKDRYVIYLLILWFFVTVFNLSKPVHIDDTVYIECAKWIAQHPLQPLSGMLNWNYTTLPMHFENFPPLFPYLLAGVIKLFGSNVIYFHLLVSLFVLGSIFIFYAIVSSFITKNRTWVTVAFFASVFYLPSQNIMLDVPMLMFWLLFFFIVLLEPIKNKLLRYSLAAIVVLIACLIKYVSIILLPILLFTIILRKDKKYIYVLLLPILGLALWSVQNYLEYGSVHIFSTGGHSHLGLTKIMKSSFDWLVVLGGVLLPLTPILVFSRLKKYMLLLCSLVAVLIICVLSKYLWQGSLLKAFMQILFLGSGLTFLYVFYKEVLSTAIIKVNFKMLILTMWLSISLLFIVVFSPFIAVRHVMLSLCPIFIAIGIFWEKNNRPLIFKISVCFSVLLAVMVAASDYDYAFAYKRYAKIVAVNYSSEQNVWFLGHWGWQWYALENNLKQYDLLKSNVQIGDIVAQPQIPIQSLELEDRGRVILIDEVKIPSSYGLIFRTMVRDGRSGFYSCQPAKCLPWEISSETLDEINIYKVVQ